MKFISKYLFYSLQIMAQRRQDMPADDQENAKEDHTDQSDVEGNVTEYESPISSDQSDDRGEEAYEHYPDCVPVENDPVRLRALRNVERFRSLKFISVNLILFFS